MNLYHYCSNEAFHSIISNQEIRLTSLSLSNDSMEGQMVNHILVEMAKKDGLNNEHIEKLQDIVSIFNAILDGLGFCLSEKKDLLSQWRGYANDAYGVSIGFSKEYLDLLSDSYKGDKAPGFVLNKVIYDPSNQEKTIKPTYIKVKELIDRGAFRPFSYKTILGTKSDEKIENENNKIQKHYHSLYMSIFPLFNELFLLKSKAFKEEVEWRLISLFGKETNDVCSFYASAGKIKPYRSFKLIDLGINPIEEIVLGPKNTTPKDIVESFLKQNNFNDVKVSHSEASYR